MQKTRIPHEIKAIFGIIHIVCCVYIFRYLLYDQLIKEWQMSVFSSSNIIFFTQRKDITMKRKTYNYDIKINERQFKISKSNYRNA